MNFTSHFASIIHELKSRNALGILSHCTGGLFYIMNEIDCADQKHIFRGELALLLVIIMNSFGVVLMLYSGSGISAISSVPYAFSFSWHLDLYLSGYSDRITDDPAKTFCDRIPAEFCSWFCLQYDAGCTQRMDFHSTV